MKPVRDFLKEIGFIQSWEEMAPVQEEFIRHMQAGLKGEKSSLPMLPAYLSPDASLSGSRKVIVMDAGGTNLRVCLMEVKPGEPVQILYHTKQPVPGKNGMISLQEFFDDIARAVAPIAGESDRIGFCFSFPCRIRPDYDGEILYLDKEVTVEGCEGALVGRELKAALARMGVKADHRVVILNDTVAALLGALAEHPAECYSGYIGMILGTGTNCCYAEKNVHILKDAALRDKPGQSIINMEAGAFNGFALTDADRLVAKYAADPERNLAEKTMSGAYQGPLLCALLTCAVQAGCFSDAFAARFRSMEEGLQAMDITAYLDCPARAGRMHDLAPEGEDARVLYDLTDALLERAAMMAVMNLTAIMRATGTGTDPLKPVAVAIEGTTFEKNETFRQKIRAWLIEYTMKQQGLHCRVMSTCEANLAGSAVAALSI